MEIYACYTAIVKVVHVLVLVDRDACGRGWMYTGEQEQWAWAQEIREHKAWPGSGWVSVSFVFSFIDTINKFHCVFGTIHLTWKPKFRFFYLKSCWPWRTPTDSVNSLWTLNFEVSCRETSQDFLPWLCWRRASHPQEGLEEEWLRLNFLPLSRDGNFGIKRWDTKNKVMFLKFLSLQRFTLSTNI